MADQARSGVLMIAWYTRKDFNRIRKLASNGGGLQANYDEWCERADHAIQIAETAGKRGEKVIVDAGDLEKWLKNKGLESTSDN
ncbi:hypothetical protein [Methylobacterium sp. Leaf466]|uniref:hypothetical protein n=1 Tax=Methylobacterium sp. Leaf466 TaxID=1736386 RepID=UPI0012E3C75A|nr:hypothetical protein [Methylobacterium sp. Leaf466]